MLPLHTAVTSAPPTLATPAYPFRLWRAVFLCLIYCCTSLSLTQSIYGQNPFDPLKGPKPEVRDALPVKPHDYVSDEAKLFSEEQRKSLSMKAAELAQRQNVHLFVVTTVYVHGESAQQRARRLADLWLRPQGLYGAIIVFDQGSRGKSAFGLSCAEDGTGVLVQGDLYRLLRNADQAASGAVGTSQNRVEAAFKSLEMGFRDLKPRLDRGRWLSPHQLLLIGMVLGSMALTLLLLWIVKRVEKKNDAKHHTTFLFPDITVLPRFGAPCGGGVMAQMDFSNTAPKL